jgi:protein SCO1
MRRPVPTVAAMLAALVACAGCGSSPKSPGAARGLAGAALPGRPLAPAFTLTDQDGRRVSLSDIRDRVVLLSFMYSTCGAPCVLIAQQVRGALDQLGGGPRPAVLIVSSDPAADTPASVRRFLVQAALAGRATYLSGTPAQMRAAWRSYPALAHGAGTRAAGRFAQVMLIDRHGVERVLYGPEQLTPESLAHDLRALADE